MLDLLVKLIIKSDDELREKIDEFARGNNEVESYLVKKFDNIGKVYGEDVKFKFYHIYNAVNYQGDKKNDI